jgi:16S rRNA processing protein RimM
MAHSGYFELGKVIRPHGFKGAVKIKFTHPAIELIEIPESVFIDLNKNLIPFFFTQFNPQSNGFAIVQFDDVDTEDAARDLSGNIVYLPQELEPVPEGNEFYSDELIGFKVIDAHHGDIGILENVMEAPAQDVFEITHSTGKEIMVPVLGNFIQEIDRKNKTLKLEAPEGLIEFYLE